MKESNWKINLVWALMIALLLAIISFTVPNILGLPRVEEKVGNLEKCTLQTQIQLNELDDTLDETNKLLVRLDERIRVMDEKSK